MAGAAVSPAQAAATAEIVYACLAERGTPALRQAAGARPPPPTSQGLEGLATLQRVRYAASRADLEFYRPPEWVWSMDGPRLKSAPPREMVWLGGIRRKEQADQRLTGIEYHEDRRPPGESKKQWRPKKHGGLYDYEPRRAPIMPRWNKPAAGPAGFTPEVGGGNVEEIARAFLERKLGKQRKVQRQSSRPLSAGSQRPTSSGGSRPASAGASRPASAGRQRPMSAPPRRVSIRE